MVAAPLPYNQAQTAAAPAGNSIELQPVKKYTWENMEERRTRIQYRPDGFLVHNLAGRKEGRTEAEKKLLQEKLAAELSTARGKRFFGDLSGSAQKNLVRAFDNLMMSTRAKIQYNQYLKKNVPFRLAMITLTIPTARELSSKDMNKRLLKPFLRLLNDYCLKQYRKPLHYLWKIELQGRGQLHWHIILNRFIPWQIAARIWNYLLKDSGLSREYYQMTGSWNVKPATKTEAVKKSTSKELRSYMLKRYLKKKVCKDVHNNMYEAREKYVQGSIDLSHFQKEIDQLQKNISQVDGSAWGCSDVLKESYPAFELDFNMYLRIKQYCKDNSGHILEFEHCMVIRNDDGEPPDKLLSPYQKGIVRAHSEYIAIGGNPFLNNLN